MRSLATRDTGSEISAALPDVLAACKVRRLRPRDRRDLRHRPGRRGDRAAGRRADVRDDARVRRREPAREDRHARLRRVRRDQQVRPQGRGRRAARRRQAGAAQPRGVRQAARRDAGVRHDGQPLQRRRRDRAVPGAAGRAWPSSAWRSRDGRLPRGGHAPQHAPGADRARRARALPGRDRRHACAATSAARASRPRWRARSSSCAQPQRMLQAGKPERAPAAEARARPRRAARGAARRRTRSKLLAHVAATCRRPTPATSTS